MSKITEPPKPIMTALGRMCRGQIIVGRDTNMQRNPQRRLNSALPMSNLNVGTLPAAPERAPVPGIARDGAAKVIADAAVHGNMKRQTVGEIGFHGGVAVDDLPNAVKTYIKPIPAHPHMNEKSKADAAKGPTATDILVEAQNLGRGSKA